MTMVPAEFSLSNTHHNNLVDQYYSSVSYRGSIGCGGDFSYEAEAELMKRVQGYEHSDNNSDLILVNQIQMAEDESRTNSLNEAAASTSNNNNNNHNREDEEIVRDDSNWLQLSIGGRSVSTDINKNQDHEEELVDPINTNSYSQQQHGTSLIAPIFNVDNQFVMSPPPPPVMFNNASLSFHQEINWAFRPLPPHPHRMNIAGAAASSSSSTSGSSSLMMPYFGLPFQFNPAAGSTSLLDNNNIRVIDPPRRPQSGVWFILQASLNQAKEPFLPQIPKSFIRIKDGGMTVRLLIKYLVNKLHLDSESQVEIRCRGEELEPLLTLQHVRDHIWSSTQRHVTTLLQPSSSSSSSSSSTTNHLMVLHYGSRSIP